MWTPPLSLIPGRGRVISGGATWPEKGKGVSLEPFRSRLLTPFFVALEPPIKRKPYEPTFIGKLVGLTLSDYSHSYTGVNTSRVI
jgi:hypothetical protein